MPIFIERKGINGTLTTGIAGRTERAPAGLWKTSGARSRASCSRVARAQRERYETIGGMLAGTGAVRIRVGRGRPLVSPTPGRTAPGTADHTIQREGPQPEPLSPARGSRRPSGPVEARVPDPYRMGSRMESWCVTTFASCHMSIRRDSPVSSGATNCAANVDISV